MKNLRYVMGWILIRPIRWLFWRMVGNNQLRMWPQQWYEWEERWYNRYAWPNPHWWLLYVTVFRFFKWLYWEAWRPLCKWDKILVHKPWYAALIQRIGDITAGGALNCYQCYHCASKDGCQVGLSNSEEYFKLTDTWTVGTPDGTDHRYRGITTCPKCGYEAEFEDGSL